MADTTLNCMEVVERMGDYLDRELSEKEVALVKEHLDACGGCANAFRWEESVLTKVKDCAKEEKAPDGLLEKLVGGLDD